MERIDLEQIDVNEQTVRRMASILVAAGIRGRRQDLTPYFPNHIRADVTVTETPIRCNCAHPQKRTCHESLCALGKRRW